MDKGNEKDIKNPQHPWTKDTWNNHQTHKSIQRNEGKDKCDAGVHQLKPGHEKTEMENAEIHDQCPQNENNGRRGNYTARQMKRNTLKRDMRFTP